VSAFTDEFEKLRISDPNSKVTVARYAPLKFGGVPINRFLGRHSLTGFTDFDHFLEFVEREHGGTELDFTLYTGTRTTTAAKARYHIDALPKEPWQIIQKRIILLESALQVADCVHCQQIAKKGIRSDMRRYYTRICNCLAKTADLCPHIPIAKAVLAAELLET
jgi:hypothetical protein